MMFKISSLLSSLTLKFVENQVHVGSMWHKVEWNYNSCLEVDHLMSVTVSSHWVPGIPHYSASDQPQRLLWLHPTLSCSVEFECHKTPLSHQNSPTSSVSLAELPALCSFVALFLCFLIKIYCPSKEWRVCTHNPNSHITLNNNFLPVIREIIVLPTLL